MAIKVQPYTGTRNPAEYSVIYVHDSGDMHLAQKSHAEMHHPKLEYYRVTSLAPLGFKKVGWIKTSRNEGKN